MLEAYGPEAQIKPQKFNQLDTRLSGLPSKLPSGLNVEKPVSQMYPSEKYSVFICIIKSPVTTSQSIGWPWVLSGEKAKVPVAKTLECFGREVHGQKNASRWYGADDSYF